MSSGCLKIRRSWGIERLLVVLAVHNDNEEAAAEQFQAEATHDLAPYIIVRQKGHNETVSNAINLFRQQFDPTADPFTAKRQSLYLTRRGGKVYRSPRIRAEVPRLYPAN